MPSTTEMQELYPEHYRCSRILADAPFIVAVTGADCIVVLVQRSLDKVSPLQEESRLRSVQQLTDCSCLIQTGSASEVKGLVTSARRAASESATLEGVADRVDEYLQKDGHPRAISCFLAGFDMTSTTGLCAASVPQLYASSLFGSTTPWKAVVRGSAYERAIQARLDQTWREGLSEEDALKVAYEACMSEPSRGGRGCAVARQLDVTVFRLGKEDEKEKVVAQPLSIEESAAKLASVGVLIAAPSPPPCRELLRGHDTAAVHTPAISEQAFLLALFVAGVSVVLWSVYHG